MAPGASVVAITFFMFSWGYDVVIMLILRVYSLSLSMRGVWTGMEAMSTESPYS